MTTSPVTVRNARPTLKHRPAIVPGILGTVYGINAEGHARYFDYDRAAAFAFAGVTAAADPRLAAVPADRRYGYVRSGATEANPRPGKRVIWVTR